MDEIHVSPGTTKPQKTTSSPTTTVNTSNGTVNLSFSRDLADFKLDPIVNPRRDDLSGVFTENDMHHIPKTISVNVIENISGEPSSSVSQETDGLQYPVDKSPPTHMCIIYGLQVRSSIMSNKFETKITSVIHCTVAFAMHDIVKTKYLRLI